MKYYKTADIFLIKYNPETKVYKLMNTIEKIDTRISLDGFKLLNPKEIKRDEFSRLMKIFFKSVKHKWTFEHSHFKKLDNFEEKGYNLSANYTLGKDIPYHTIEGKEYFGNLILVYHWGKVYYHTISYNGYPQGQLICPKTFSLVRWARLKNCSPIFNIDTKKIC